jgi:putative membrane protein
MGPGMDMGMGMGWMWLWGALMLVGIVLLVVVLARALSGGNTRGDSSSQAGRPPWQGGSLALDLLDERYARGELSTEEYQERVRVLEEGH